MIKLCERVGPLLIAHYHGRLVADLWCPCGLSAVVELSGKVHVDGLRARWLVELHDRVGRLLIRKCLYLLVALGGRRFVSRRVVDHLRVAFALHSFILLEVLAVLGRYLLEHGLNVLMRHGLDFGIFMTVIVGGWQEAAFGQVAVLRIVL